MIRIRNEKYGGTSFDQTNGDFLRFNHDVLKLIMKRSFQEELTKDEITFLDDNFPTFQNPETKFELLIKKVLSSPYEIPLVSEGPEFVDLSLGNKCNLHCKFCYTSSGKNGHFISMTDYDHVLEELDQNRIYQVAIGGGEPTLHPHFPEILDKMRTEYSIVPNYTTNGTLLTPELIQLSAELCGAVAMSYHPDRVEEQLKIMRSLADGGVNAVLHVVADHSTLPDYATIAQQFGEAGMNAIAFLLFKPTGRGKTLHNEILTVEDSLELDQQFKDVFDLSREYRFTVGFDTCFAPFLATFDRCVKGTYDSCTGARVSAYIDWDLDVKPCSFMQDEKGVSLKEYSLQEIWWGEYFDSFRKKLLKASHTPCKRCENFLYCFGGCPFHPDIVLCEKRSTVE